MLLSKLIVGHGQSLTHCSRIFRQEFNYAAVLGLGAAVDYALSIGLEKIAARVRLK